jgi:hypothetical protein
VRLEDAGVGLRIASYTALILFFELALIRYTAGYVRLFGFYLNFVLIATFLGMGVGLLRARDADRLRWMAVPILMLLFGAIALFSETHIRVPQDPSDYLWGVNEPRASTTREMPLFAVTATLFALCALFFVPLGAELGRHFSKLPPLRAYSWDIAGSIAGIVAFGVLSALRQPPVIWFALGLSTWVLLSWFDRRFAVSLAAVAVLSLGLVRWMSVGREYWSPYYRITVSAPGPLAVVEVNGALHQVVLALDSARTARVPSAQRALIGYRRPYDAVGRVDTALVVGAGTGNDVAILLARGVRYVDAVEIDPIIADLGRILHPQQPYSDPRVQLHVDDARAFLRKANRRYDVIVFGTLDSQTLLSGMSSVRLDNYVYTRESFESARARLKPDGTLILYHLSGYPYVEAKIYQMVRDAFGSPPAVIREHMGLFNLTLVAGEGAGRLPPVAPDSVLTQTHRQARDDWPYLYLRGRTLPTHYAVALGAVLLIALALIAVAGADTLRRGVDGSMFLMGAGFLLVETKSVTEMSLLFGSTWTVNLLVFGSIMVMVFIANLIVIRRRPSRLHALFAGLFGSLALAYVTPARALLGFGVAAQWIVGGILVALPILFASMIFSTLLSQRGDGTRALAYNLLGAIVGGVLEYSSMLLGIKALYVLAAALYLGAFLLARHTLKRNNITSPSLTT